MELRSVSIAKTSEKMYVCRQKDRIIFQISNSKYTSLLQQLFYSISIEDAKEILSGEKNEVIIETEDGNGQLFLDMTPKTTSKIYFGKQGRYVFIAERDEILNIFESLLKEDKN